MWSESRRRAHLVVVGLPIVTRESKNSPIGWKRNDEDAQDDEQPGDRDTRRSVPVRSPPRGDADEGRVGVQFGAKCGPGRRHAILQVDVRRDLGEAIFHEHDEALVDLNGQSPGGLVSKREIRVGVMVAEQSGIPRINGRYEKRSSDRKVWLEEAVRRIGRNVVRVFKASAPFDQTVLFRRSECRTFHFSLDSTGWRINRIQQLGVSLELDCQLPSGDSIVGKAKDPGCL